MERELLGLITANRDPDNCPSSVPAVHRLVWIKNLYPVTCNVPLRRDHERRSPRLACPGTGPSRLPMVGNMFNMPRSRQWIGYCDLSRQHGDVMYLQILGQSIVVLGSPDAIFEYLDKRSANTSDRMQTPMIELSGSSLNFGFMPYEPWWRRHRRAFWQHFHRDAVEGYQPTQQSVTRIFLEALLENPSSLRQLIRFNFAAVVLKVVLQHRSSGRDRRVCGDVGASTGWARGGYGARQIPRRVPAVSSPHSPLVPGRNVTEVMGEVEETLKNAPFEHTRAKMVNEKTTQSMVGKLLGRVDQWDTISPEEEEIIKDVGAVAFEAGTDTVGSTLLGLFAGISLHPEVLKKAHAELDAVVGPHRLPDFSDRDSLPYVSAIIKESMRWHSAVPFGVPHATVADDEFGGYFIPARTMLIPNIYLNLPRASGRHFAQDTLFINVACVLHVFDIRPPVGDDGLPIKIEYIQSDTLISYPEDCRCTITPRSAAAEALIRSCAAAARAERKD